MEEQVREAILTELRRQSEDPGSEFSFHAIDGRLKVSAEVDLVRSSS